MKTKTRGKPRSHLEVRREALKLLEKQRELSELAESESRNFTESEQSDFDEWQEQKQALLATADRLELLEKDGRSQATPVTSYQPNGKPVGKIEYRDRNGLPVFVIGSDGKLSDEPTQTLGEPQERQARIGKAIYGMVTGRWEGLEVERRVLSEGSQSSGGYTVPSVLSSQVIDAARKKSTAIQAGMKVVTFESSGELSMARIDTDATPAWYGESSTIAASDFAFGKMVFSPRKLAVIVKASRELVADSPNASDVIESALAEIFAAEIDRVVYAGNGADEPLGIFNIDSSDLANQATSIGGTTFYDEFIDAYAAVTGNNGAPNAIVVANDVNKFMAKKRTGDATNAAAMNAERPEMLASLPWFLSNQLSNGQALVADFSEVHLGVRQEFELDVSTDAGFATDEVWIRATARVDTGFGRKGNFIATLAGITS